MRYSRRSDYTLSKAIAEPNNVCGVPGTGVAFNWGRILTAVGVLLGGQLMLTFGGDYSRVGQVTCLVYSLGLVVICFAPNTAGKSLD